MWYGTAVLPFAGPRYAVPVYAYADTMTLLASRILAEPIVVPCRRAIASGYISIRRVLAKPRFVCVRRKSNPAVDRDVYFAVFSGCVLTGTMIVLARL